jgi:formate-dependent nitrite reductase membrane component NrfD
MPSAVAGAGMATYTAALLAATSTPLWAAAPRALGVRFAASSIASGAAALALGEGSRRTRRALDAIAVAALATELAAATAQRRTTRARGIAPAGEGAATAAAGGWDRAERAGLSGLGMALPLGLHAMALAGVGGARASRLAALATLAGGLLMRTATLGTGQASATRPGTAFRFAQPDNLPGASYIRKISPARRRYRA